MVTCSVYWSLSKSSALTEVLPPKTSSTSDTNLSWTSGWRHVRTWQKKRSDGTEDDESLALVKAEVERIVSIFCSPLDAKAVMYVAVIQDEIQEATVHMNMILPIGTETHRKIWYKLETTSRVEQLFSKLKTIKTDQRTNLKGMLIWLLSYFILFYKMNILCVIVLYSNLHAFRCLLLTPDP